MQQVAVKEARPKASATHRDTTTAEGGSCGAGSPGPVTRADPVTSASRAVEGRRTQVRPVSDTAPVCDDVLKSSPLVAARHFLMQGAGVGWYPATTATMDHPYVLQSHLSVVVTAPRRTALEDAVLANVQTADNDCLFNSLP
jgi:hypothetical protein